MAIDPKNLDSPSPSTSPTGLITADEVWNEIGWPVEDNSNAQSYTPIETIQATIDRVLRGYEDQAIATIEKSDDMERYSRLSEQQKISLSDSSAVEGLAVGTVPNTHLPYFLGKVVAPDGTPLAAKGDLSKLQHTSLSWDDYAYELAGRDLFALPESLQGSDLTVYLIPETDAIETALDEIVPQINSEILQAAAQALERRTGEAQRIEQEAAGETPST